MHSKLMNLMLDNKAHRADAVKKAEKLNNMADSNVILLYDFVAGSESEAEFFGGVSAQSVIEQLDNMTGDVHLHIDSPGGSVFGGRAMAAAIQRYEGKVIAYVDGLAASAASFIAVACDEVVMAEGSFLMIHKAWTFAMGNAEELRADADLMDRIDQSIAGTYAKKAGDDVDWLTAMSDETWYGADEAVEVGLADALAKPKKEQARMDWNLNAYSNAPKIDKIEEPIADTVEGEEEFEKRKRQLAVALLEAA